MTITSVNAPAVSAEGIKRLVAFCRPKKMTKDDTLFVAGYEQAKRDFIEMLEAEIGIEKPKSADKSDIILSVPASEVSARKALETAKPWWHW